MSDLHFADPGWSVALWLVAAVVALLLWLDWRRGDAISRFLSATMQSRLVNRPTRGRRWSSIVLLGMAAGSLVVALMRPQWGLTYHQMPRVGTQIMVCLDVSKSMLAEDTAPNRLERAKAELVDLLSFLDGDQVGLIAFAGRASVLCPLTPDFGFFRLALENAGPHSVGRGGTRLEEPIRKALDGFRTESDVSRAILLVTDGEDHDSHPLDAAKAAAERGVKILAIGFGDEAGSEVQVTDTRTGVRSILRDAGGAPVVTRLDGETLREIALATAGAYIPAGTGALDLKSIHDAHIAPLMRGRLDDRGRAVRREVYPWAVLGGLLLLVASVVVGSRSLRPGGTAEAFGSPPQRRSMAGAAALWIALTLPLGGQAQEVRPSAIAESSEETIPVPQTPSEPHADPEASDPRDLYNRALAHLEVDPDRAERLLTEARRRSGTDGEVRYRATYNMGWVEMQRAGDRIGEQPEEALAHLRRAADWFRDCVRLRPEHHDARHNLEVVLRRILQLADALAGSGTGNVPQRLDALIEAERGLVAAAREVVARVAAEEDSHGTDALRNEFRQLAVRQRQVLSDCQALSAKVREELDSLRAKGDEEMSPQDRLRVAQLGGVVHYTHRAEQRMGQARSQMRLRQAERAFRRTAAALDELKRSRDQLRDPVEILDAILADASALARWTRRKGAATEAAPDTDRSRPQTAPWLTGEFLGESQLGVTERTSELAERLHAGLEQGPSHDGGAAEAAADEQAEADRFLAQVGQAMPYLAIGVDRFETAGEALADERFGEAAERQMEAISALRDARERFLGLRGLIELAYARQAEILQLLSLPASETSENESPGEAGEPGEQNGAEHESPAVALEAARIAERRQRENVERCERIAALVVEEFHTLPALPTTTDSADGDAPSVPDSEQAAARKRLELAKELLHLAGQQMGTAADSLATGIHQHPWADLPVATGAGVLEEVLEEKPAIDGDAAAAAREHAEQALAQLQALRRLFFSVAEHLRETAQRQVQLNDETEQVAALPEDETLAKRAGSLALRQQELRGVVEMIAAVLDEHAAEPLATDLEQADPTRLDHAQQIAEQLGKAADLVAEAARQMEEAGQSLAAEEPHLELARTRQDEALARLIAALALLQPPQPDQENQPDQGEPGDSQQQDGQTRQPGMTDVDPSRLLQAIRDREAERRRDRQERQRFQQEPVERDW